MTRYVAARLRTHGRSTIRTQLMALRAFYRWQVKERRRRDDPTRGISIARNHPEPQPPLTAQEIAAMLDAARTDRDRALVLVFIGAGVRLSELLGMTTESIDWSRGQVKIVGKGSRERWVVPGLRAMRALRLYLDGRQGRVWLTVDGRPMTKLRLWKILQRLADEAGVASVHPHRFRTTFANMILEAGADLQAVQHMMGHERMETTAGYARWTATARALDQQRRLNPADRLLT